MIKKIAFLFLIASSSCTIYGAKPSACDFPDSGAGPVDITNVCVCIENDDAGAEEYKIFTCK